MDLTIKCCVVDDEPLARELISGFVNKTPFLELENAYSSASEAIKSIISGKVDLVFLDIKMPELNGMEFSKILPKNCRAIFVTAYDQYAIEGFRHNAIDYLLKPVSYEEFLAAANKAYEWFVMNKKSQIADNNQLNERKHIIVKSEYKLVQIDLSKIVYIEGLKDYIKFYLDDTPNTVLTLMNMKTIEQNLPADKFIRVHSSYIVNVTKIKTIERNRIVFGSKYIPISETYKKNFTTYLQNHLVFTDRSGNKDITL